MATTPFDKNLVSDGMGKPSGIDGTSKAASGAVHSVKSGQGLRLSPTCSDSKEHMLDRWARRMTCKRTPASRCPGGWRGVQFGWQRVRVKPPLVAAPGQSAALAKASSSSCRCARPPHRSWGSRSPRSCQRNAGSALSARARPTPRCPRRCCKWGNGLEQWCA